MRKWFQWAAIATLILSAGAALAQVKPATPIKLGKIHEFSMEKDQVTDLGIQLTKGNYYIRIDMALAEPRPSNLIMQIDLHKTNGVVVQTGLIYGNEIDKNARIAKVFRVAADGSYRLRLKHQSSAAQYWLTLMPEKDRKPADYGWGEIEYKPLGIGTNNGKGGTLESIEDPGWDAWHTMTLEAGKYNISLYLAHPEDISSNLVSEVEMYDIYGLRKPDWKLYMNEIGKESRVEKALILTKQTKVIFRVRNMLNKPINYIVGIEKA